MGAMTRNRRRKPGHDRINELSDDVLCHILSFLSTKEAAVTSLLSSRWRFLWSMVPSLHIKCSKPIMKFYKRVKTFLGLLRTEKITRFHLKCNSHDCCSHYVEEWVSAVIARKVEELNISLCVCHTNVLSFPALFICTTIVTLKLEGPFDLYIPSSVRLPNVKTLHLHINTCFPILNISKLIFGSPALELFYLRKYKHCFDELNIVLNSRDIQLFHRNWVYDIVIQSDRDYDFISYYMENRRWPNIVKAKVDLTVDFELEQTVHKLLQGLRNVEFLSLNYFRHEKDPLTLTLDHPLFKNLVELQLFLKRDDPLFMELPAKCPKLEFLEFNIMDDRYRINKRYRYHISGGVREHDLSIVTV